ncbi:MAG: folate-binding protein YgfZ [Actinobacteria bacterium]|nr:folate-binding protein YgfZ [Actinomycetota bacterium]
MTGDAVAPPPEWFDQGVPWHYGDPLAEQRALAAGRAVVDLRHYSVISVSGPDRLGWLHDLTTAHLRELAAGSSRLALILDPNGRVQYELHLIDDGATTWLITPDATGLVAYLDSMRFLLRVEVADRTADLAVLGVTGIDVVPVEARIAVWHVPPEFAGTGSTDAGSDRGGDAGKYVPDRPGVFPAAEVIVARSAVAQLLSGADRAGTWAWAALRVAAGVPRIGVDTDDRTLPNEVGWVGPAVHLDKGCYRGQEAVARTHNMGRPPRRLTKLLLADGDELPATGAELYLDGRRVGRMGTVVVHHEEGPIALALIRSRIAPDAALETESGAASQEPVVVVA